MNRGLGVLEIVSGAGSLVIAAGGFYPREQQLSRPIFRPSNAGPAARAEAGRSRLAPRARQRRTGPVPCAGVAWWATRRPGGRASSRCRTWRRAPIRCLLRAACGARRVVCSRGEHGKCPDQGQVPRSRAQQDACGSSLPSATTARLASTSREGTRPWSRPPLAGAVIIYSDHMTGADGEAMFRHACRLGLEGIVSKRATSRYRSSRCASWAAAETGSPRTSRRQAHGHGRAPLVRQAAADMMGAVDRGLVVWA
jgi:hypothetical protein